MAIRAHINLLLPTPCPHPASKTPTWR
jgi:hypothetical protein